MNKYDAVLESFCQVQDGYYHSDWEKEPRPHNDNIFATDARKLIRVAKHLCSKEYTAHEKQPTAFDRIVPTEDCSFLFPVDEILKLINKIPESELIEVSGEMAECVECDGKGYVEWQYEDSDGERHYHDYDCPLCDGRGSFEKLKFNRDERYFEINGLFVRVGYLLTVCFAIQMLGHKCATVKHLKENEAILINIEPGVDAIIMPANDMKPAQSITLKPTES